MDAVGLGLGAREYYGINNVCHSLESDRFAECCARHSNLRLFWWLCRRGPYALSIDFPFATRLAFSCEGVVLVKDFFLIVEKSYECEHNPTSNYVPQLVGRVHN